MVHSSDNRNSTQSERQTLQERGEGEGRNTDVVEERQKQKQKEMARVKTNNLTRVCYVTHLKNTVIL